MPRKKKNENNQDSQNVDRDGQKIPKFKAKDLQIPCVVDQRLLDIIGEISPNGFLFFTINEEGEVQFYASQHGTASETGLRVQAMHMLSNLHEIEYQNIGSQLFGQMLDQGMLKKPEEEDENNNSDDDFLDQA